MVGGVLKMFPTWQTPCAAQEMAQLVKGLVCKGGNLSVTPQHKCKKSGMVAHTCDHSSGEAGSLTDTSVSSMLSEQVQ